MLKCLNDVINLFFMKGMIPNLKLCETPFKLELDFFVTLVVQNGQKQIGSIKHVQTEEIFSIERPINDINQTQRENKTTKIHLIVQFCLL